MKKTILYQLIGLALFFSACSSKSNNPDQKDSTIYVKTYKTGLQKNVADKKYIGVIEEEMSASISFSVMGNIEKIYVAEGQKVKKGELLAELNAYSLKNAHNAALATLKQAEDAMKRLQSLYDKKSLPEIQYIEMQTNLEKARSAEAIALKNLKDSRLTAPFPGIVGSTQAEVGENILPNQSVLTLLRIDQVKVKISVPEKEINSIDIGQSASIQVSAANGAFFSGIVNKKGIVAAPISHTYPLRITVDNSDNVLLPGMVCDVFINNNEEENIILLPNQCILKDGNGKTFVWKIVDGHTQKQIIETGRQKTGGVEVLDGLDVNDEIVSDGYQKVSNGQKVTVL